MTKKLEEITFSYKPANGFREQDSPQNPFTIAFCYPRFKDPFVLKGGWVDVEKFLLEKKEPMMAHITFWWKKSHRTLIRAYNLTENVQFDEGGKLSGKRWRIYVYKNGEKKTLATIRRIPRKWLKELNPYCPMKRGEHKRLFRLEKPDEEAREN